ncbi:MAG: Asp-tRNA(Asn)/Glu-tRNA(Gln) amidotransferase subunit GatC [Deltaproteobacteria bacterium]
MKISKEAVKHVAELARLEVGEGEIDKLAEQLGNIFEYVEDLGKLDTSLVDPTFHVSAVSTPVRDDVVETWLNTEETLANAPERDETFFSVPKVIED